MKNIGQFLVGAVAIIAHVQFTDARAIRIGGKSAKFMSKRADRKVIPLPAGTPEKNPYRPNYEGIQPQYLGWNADNLDDAAKNDVVTLAIDQVPFLVEAVWQYLHTADGKPKSPKPPAFLRWFGESIDIEKVWSVYNQIVVCDGLGTDNVDCELDEAIADTVLVRKDWLKDCGSTGSAYTRGQSGHFTWCPHGYKKPALFDVRCDKLKEWIPEAMNTASIFLHEMTHVDAITGEIFAETDEQGNVIGEIEGTRDIVESAYEALEIDENSRLQNAENYALLANEAYFLIECGKTFSDPKDEDDFGDLTAP